MKPSLYIWKNGELIPWEQATVHVMTHALHYASAVFEGMRAYETDKGPAIFRAKEHFVRLENSAKIYHMKPPFTVEQMTEATQQLIKANQLKSCYIRPIWYYGYGKMGLNPGTNPVEAVIAAWEWGSYLGEEGLAKGIRCKISSWARVDSRVLPATAKSAANYANSALANIEAKNSGFDEAIQLSINGTVSEGPGENIFMIKDGALFTPPSSDNALQGITAQSAAKIAQDLGYSVTSRSIGRDELFTADELFFTGTAAEITPIRDIDGRTIGKGSRGPITEAIQSTFFDAVKGKNPAYASWLTV
jgi:branched-chain amino acid aminotransferase